MYYNRNGDTSSFGNIKVDLLTGNYLDKGRALSFIFHSDNFSTKFIPDVRALSEHEQDALRNTLSRYGTYMLGQSSSYGILAYRIINEALPPLQAPQVQGLQAVFGVPPAVEPAAHERDDDRDSSHSRELP